LKIVAEFFLANMIVLVHVTINKLLKWCIFLWVNIWKCSICFFI